MAPPIFYSRALPAGGYVAIDCSLRGTRHHARLWVERRADLTRRSGHAPPILLEVEEDDSETAIASLREVAADNVSLAQAIRRWHAARTAAR